MSALYQIVYGTFWFRMDNGKENKMAYILYKFMYLEQSQNNYTSEWINFVKNILDTCGYNNMLS